MTIKTINKISSFDDLKKMEVSLNRELLNKKVISLCSGNGCKAYASDDVYEKIMEDISKRTKLGDKSTENLIVKRTGCPGFCERGPVIVIYPEEVCYLDVKPEDAAELVETVLKD